MRESEGSMTEKCKRQLKLLPMGKGNSDLPELIRFHRLRLRLGVQEVAKALDVDEATLLSYEAGSLSIPLEDIYVLANLLNIAPEDIDPFLS
jgi:transcriptional regulator with XRE-family HTH domain